METAEKVRSSSKGLHSPIQKREALKVEVDQAVTALLAKRPHNAIAKITKISSSHWAGIRGFDGTEEQIPAWKAVNNLRQTGLTAERQTEIEQKMGYEPGTLDPTNSSFWNNFSVALPQSGREFNLADAQELLEFFVVSQASVVVFGADRRKQNPNASWLLELEGADAEVVSQRNHVKLEAMAVFTNLTPAEKLHIAYIFKARHAVDKSDVEIKNMVFEIAENTPQAFLSACKDPLRKEKAAVSLAVQQRIVTVTRGRYLYYDHELGKSLNAAAEYLRDHDDIYDQLKKDIQLKTATEDL